MLARPRPVLGVTLVPGVEFSAVWRHQSIHILGLWIDPASRTLRDALNAQADRRRARMRKLCAGLTKAGLPGDELLSAVEANPGLPTRSHLAAALVAGGHVHRVEDAFRKYLGHGKRAHVCRRLAPIEEAVPQYARQAASPPSLTPPATPCPRGSPPARGRLRGGGRSALEIVSGANGAQHAAGETPPWRCASGGGP